MLLDQLQGAGSRVVWAPAHCSLHAMVEGLLLKLTDAFGFDADRSKTLIL